MSCGLFLFCELGEGCFGELTRAAMVFLAGEEVGGVGHVDDGVAVSVVEDGVDEPAAEKCDECAGVLYRFYLGVCFLYDVFVEMGHAVDFGCLTLDGDGVDVVVVVEDADEGWQPVWRLMAFKGEPDVVGEETVMGELIAEPLHVVMVAFHLDEMDARWKAGL